MPGPAIEVSQYLKAESVLKVAWHSHQQVIVKLEQHLDNLLLDDQNLFGHAKVNASDVSQRRNQQPLV
jgi:hypothetical protein